MSDRLSKKTLRQVDLLFCITENTKHLFCAQGSFVKANASSNTKATNLQLKPVWQSTHIYEYNSTICMCLIICLLPVVGTYQ